MENIFAHNNHSFQKLSYLLKNLRRNTIIWISTESPEQQKKILSDIKTEFSNSLNQHTFSLLDYKDGSVYHFIKNAFPTETINSKDKPTAIHLLFADSLIIPKEKDITNIENTSPFVDNLNYERDVLYHKLPYTLIFWTAPTALQIIRRSALDFADWLTYTFEFKEEKEPTVNHHFIPTKTETIVEKISLDDAKNMFAAYNPIPYPSEKIESLLKNIHCYPILIEICAKQLYVNDTINIDTLINAAIQSDFSLLNDNPITLSDDAYTETALDTFITQIFAPQSLSLEEQQCLMYFSLLKNIPYPLTKLQQWFEDKDNNLFIENIPHILFKLNQKGWLQVTEIVENNENIVYYQCHLIVSYAIRKLLVPTTDNCIAFLENIKKEGHYFDTEYIIDRVQYLPELLQIITLFTEEKFIIADILISINNFYLAIGDYTEALDYGLKALSIREKVLGQEHPDTATAYNNIGGVYYAMGDYPQALIYYQQALTICEKVLGKEHIDTATPYNNIGGIYHAIGDYAQALVYHQKALIIREKVFGKNHFNTAISYNNIGEVYRDMNDYLQALEYYQQACTIFEKMLGKEHLNTATTYNNIGVVYHAIGDYLQALVYYQQALPIYENIIGKKHPSTAITYNNFALVYEVLHEYNKALEYIDKSIAIIEKKLPETHPNRINSVKTREKIKEKIKENKKK